MKALLNIIFPEKAANTLRGSQWPFYLLVLITVIGTVRSCIHIFSPDGGAGSIAGMNLAVAGADGIIFSFALWGSEQLIFAICQWIVILRYRALVPLMWVVQLLEILGRMLVGRLKPVTFAHTPPGEIGNSVFLVLSLAMILLAVCSGLKTVKEEPIL